MSRLLSMTGQVLRAGRVQLQDGGIGGKTLQESLFSGIHVEDARLQAVTGATGAGRDVLFAWGTPAGSAPAQ